MTRQERARMTSQAPPLACTHSPARTRPRWTTAQDRGPYGPRPGARLTCLAHRPQLEHRESRKEAWLEQELITSHRLAPTARHARLTTRTSIQAHLTLALTRSAPAPHERQHARAHLDHAA